MNFKIMYLLAIFFILLAGCTETTNEPSGETHFTQPPPTVTTQIVTQTGSTPTETVTSTVTPMKDPTTIIFTMYQPVENVNGIMTTDDKMVYVADNSQWSGMMPNMIYECRIETYSPSEITVNDCHEYEYQNDPSIAYPITPNPYTRSLDTQYYEFGDKVMACDKHGFCQDYTPSQRPMGSANRQFPPYTIFK